MNGSPKNVDLFAKDSVQSLCGLFATAGCLELTLASITSGIGQKPDADRPAMAWASDPSNQGGELFSHPPLKPVPGMGTLVCLPGAWSLRWASGERAQLPRNLRSGEMAEQGCVGHAVIVCQAPQRFSGCSPADELVIGDQAAQAQWLRRRGRFRRGIVGERAHKDLRVYQAENIFPCAQSSRFDHGINATASSHHVIGELVVSGAPLGASERPASIPLIEPGLVIRPATLMRGCCGREVRKCASLGSLFSGLLSDLPFQPAQFGLLRRLRPALLGQSSDGPL
jgi:hypothetical protein